MTSKIILPKPTKLVVQERMSFVPRSKPLMYQRGFMKMMPSIGLWSRGLPVFHGVDFNGSTDLLSRNSAMSGVSSNANGMLSMWFRLDGGDGVHQNLLTLQNGGVDKPPVLLIQRNTLNNLRFLFDAGDNLGNRYIYTSTGTLTASAAWRHLLLSWFVHTNAANAIFQAYVDGSAIGLTSDLGSLSVVAYAAADTWYVAATPDGIFELGKFNGAQAEIYLNTDTRLDISSASNLAKFRTPDGRPANLGFMGEKPTGSQPIMYLSVRRVGQVAHLAQNRGYGGNLAVQGTPTLSDTTPSQ